jgi:hypothetical protein
MNIPQDLSFYELKRLLLNKQNRAFFFLRNYSNNSPISSLVEHPKIKIYFNLNVFDMEICDLNSEKILYLVTKLTKDSKIKDILA